MTEHNPLTKEQAKWTSKNIDLSNPDSNKLNYHGLGVIADHVQFGHKIRPHTGIFNRILHAHQFAVLMGEITIEDLEAKKEA